MLENKDLISFCAFLELGCYVACLCQYAFSTQLSDRSDPNLMGSFYEIQELRSFDFSPKYPF